MSLEAPKKEEEDHAVEIRVQKYEEEVSEFYETLLPNLQALETMGKIREVNGYVRMTLDKLQGTRGD